MSILALRWRVPPPPLRFRWVLPLATAPAIVSLAPPDAIVAIIGQQGAEGLAGGQVPSASLVVEADVAAGMPLALNRASGRLVPADAAIYARATVIGLAIAAARSGFSADARGVGSLALDDWSAVTGTPALMRGRLYYLAVGGGITMLPPSTSGHAVTVIGEAVTPTILDLRRSPPILR